MAQTTDNDHLIEGSFEKSLRGWIKKVYWLDELQYQGKYQYAVVNDFESEFQKLNFRVFPDLNNRSRIYYRKLENLDIKEKQQLIRKFNFCKQEYEALFKKSKLPIEFMLLPPAFSILENDDFVRSRLGFWQLNHFQAILNGLEVNKQVDERLNPFLSTKAALKDFKKSIELFNSNELAIFSYLVGNTKLRNTVLRAGDKPDYNEVLSYLPHSIQEFVAAFQALAVFLTINNFEPNNEHYLKEIPDTVEINRKMHFQQIASIINVSLDELQFLNPQIKYAIIPGNGKSYKLALPKGKWDDFVLFQDSIIKSYDSTLFQIEAFKIEYPPEPSRQFITSSSKIETVEDKTRINYKIKTGDVLGVIAEKYDVRVTELKYWNGIYNERKIRAGQNLIIYVDKEMADIQAKIENEERIKTESAKKLEKIISVSNFIIPGDNESKEKIEHVVKSGESPYVIAKKYESVTPENILEWNGIDDPRKIRIGQKLIVFIKK